MWFIAREDYAKFCLVIIGDSPLGNASSQTWQETLSYCFLRIHPKKVPFFEKVKHLLLRKCHTSPTFCKEYKLSFSVFEKNIIYWNIFFFYPLRKFLRVLPLPSENWSALVEEWCCHPNPFARSTLHPQHGDCFLGDTFFLLNSGNESHVPESPMCCSETGHHTSQNGSNLVKYFVWIILKLMYLDLFCCKTLSCHWFIWLVCITELFWRS